MTGFLTGLVNELVKKEVEAIEEFLEPLGIAQIIRSS